MKNKIRSAHLLDGDKKLNISSGKDGLITGLPSEAPDAIATVIKVVVKGKVENQFEINQENVVTETH